MLRALFSVMQNEINNPDPIYILSPSTVVHTYCRNHQNCEENEEVQNLVHFLEENVLKQFDKNLLVRTNREKVITIDRIFAYEFSSESP